MIKTSRSSSLRFESVVARLYQESIVRRLLGWIRIKGGHSLDHQFDDQVDDLQASPLVMFFYNQRAILFLCGTIFLLVLTVLITLLPSTKEMFVSVLVLAIFWFLDATITLSLHPLLRKRIAHWSPSISSGELPPIFDLYFVLDNFLVLFLIIVGRALNLSFEAFAFLLFSNLVVHSAYIRTRQAYYRLVVFLWCLGIIPILFISGGSNAFNEPRWFYAILYLGPLLGALVATTIFLAAISSLRIYEHQITQHRLQLLGVLESFLSEPADISSTSPNPLMDVVLIEQQFENQILKVLKYICSLGNPFWYRSACLWFVEQHQDRGTVMVPGLEYNFDKLNPFKEGIDKSTGLLTSDILMLSRSSRHNLQSNLLTLLEITHNIDAPAAYIPLQHAAKQIGALTLYGEKDGPKLQHQEDAFLRSLGSIISNAMGHWDARYKALSQAEMDNLFKCNNLQEVFHRAAKIMQKYLKAEGCMVVFRPNPAEANMHIMAIEGFSNVIYKRNLYEVGKGQTGRCAETGAPIRWDDVSKHTMDFDSELLDSLELAHGKPIYSWLAIPIGSKGGNYGVIKVVNRTSHCHWFRDEDEELGLSLALRLQVIIEKFLFIEKMSSAMEEAKSKSEEAIIEKKRAEEAALQRQEDLMIITHQLYGPLYSVIGGITNLKRKNLPHHVEESLEYVQALVEDCYAFCYGTCTTLAASAGSELFFRPIDVDAPTELKLFCKRLQKINSRQDLSFSFHLEPNFPTLRMDRGIFTGVFYNLIHNAMKYSDPFSEVSLICGFEKGKAVIKMNDIGEPILPNEAKGIFEKFQRGKSIKEKGSHGTGLGLWVARELMRAIGGDLTVELSTSHPRLSIFIVHFPEM